VQVAAGRREQDLLGAFGAHVLAQPAGGLEVALEPSGALDPAELQATAAITASASRTTAAMRRIGGAGVVRGTSVVLRNGTPNVKH